MSEIIVDLGKAEIIERNTHNSDPSAQIIQPTLSIYPKQEYDRCLAKDIKVQMDGLVISAQEIKRGQLAWSGAISMLGDTPESGQVIKIADMAQLIGQDDYDAGWRLANPEFSCRTTPHDYDVKVYVDNHQLMLAIPPMTNRPNFYAEISHPCFGNLNVAIGYRAGVLGP